MTTKKEKGQISDKPAELELPEEIEIKLGKAFMWGLPGTRDGATGKISRNPIQLTVSAPGPVKVSVKDLSEQDKFVLVESMKKGLIVEASVEINRTKTSDELIALVKNRATGDLRQALQMLVRERKYQPIVGALFAEKDKAPDARDKGAIIMLRQALQSIYKDPEIAKDKKVHEDIGENLKMIGIELVPSTFVTKPSEQTPKTGKNKKAKDK